jgi:pyruvate/2-oxoglutarate/acetoin dehydrogenase E1 component
MIAEDALDYLDAPIIRVASFDAPQPANKTLVQLLTIDKSHIVSGVKKALR